MTFSGNLFTRNKFCLALLVITDRKKTKSTVNTNNMADVYFLKIFHSFCNRDMEIPPAFKLYKFCCPEFIRTVKIFSKMLAFKWAFGSPIKGINRQCLSIVYKTVVSITNKVSLWTAEKYSFQSHSRVLGIRCQSLFSSLYL